MVFTLNTIIFFIISFVFVFSEKVTYDTTCTLTEEALSNVYIIIIIIAFSGPIKVL